MSTEKQRIIKASSNQEIHVSLTIPWMKDTISQSLSDMELSFHNKRKHASMELLEPLLSNTMALKYKILEEVIEIEPGLWTSIGAGLIENDDLVNFVFSRGSNEGPSKIITKVEKRFKGKVQVFKRLSGIKQAAREKHVKETIHKFDDETCLIEFGRDPYGKGIFNIPIFKPSPSLTINGIGEIQGEEDAKFSMFANDILESHSQEE
ncbi:hypothetical protein V6N13_096831 [Hibiscus sabdariffa]|uniref:Uncharacterized protein n=1 Tax=Hibiscus sabdariffa TaxID=183260 RepID=A0ABR2C8V8_9ROSI